MGKYLERLQSEHDEITKTNTAVLDRAADENRELSDDERQIVERADTRRDELAKAITYYGEQEARTAKVADTLAKVPSRPVASTVVVEREAEPPKIGDLFGSVGEYICTVHRAVDGRDKAAAELIERAGEILRATTTQHQTLADNPGIVPRPVLQPLITLVDDERPFIQSITKKPLPAGSFDRPTITQHVAVGKQSAEKQQTESRKLLIGKLPVSAATYAGHLNISRQDIKWTSPGIMQIVAEDFAHEYAMETDSDAAAQFVAGLSGANDAAIDAWDGATIRKALFAAAIVPAGSGEPVGAPDTLWMSGDVWAELGGMTNSQGLPVFPGLSPGNPAAGDVAGFKPVYDPFFPAGTLVLGKARLCEWYEDVDGLIQVSEPDVLGQLVGYAGYGAFLNTAPQVFTVFTTPAADDSGGGGA